jgi:hypothetical protein
VTGPNDDDDAESQDEATSSETLVDGEAGQAHKEPTGTTLEQTEIDDIEGQHLAITLANQGRAEQVLLDDKSVN